MFCSADFIQDFASNTAWVADQGDMESAKRHFTSAAMAKCNGRPNIAGTLALASVYFQQGNYNAALGHYRKALREHPGAPAEVRLGLAACLFRLGQVSQAKAAYQRTLDLSPSSGEALLGLAVIAFNSKDAEKYGLRFCTEVKLCMTKRRLYLVMQLYNAQRRSRTVK